MMMMMMTLINWYINVPGAFLICVKCPEIATPYWLIIIIMMMMMMMMYWCTCVCQMAENGLRCSRLIHQLRLTCRDNMSENLALRCELRLLQSLCYLLHLPSADVVHHVQEKVSQFFLSYHQETSPDSDNIWYTILRTNLPQSIVSIFHLA